MALPTADDSSTECSIHSDAVKDYNNQCQSAANRPFRHVQSLRDFPSEPCRIFDNVYIIVSSDISGCSIDSPFRYFCIEGVLKYFGFCDDFGPMNLGTIFDFCKLLEKELRCTPSGKFLALQVPPSARSLTNALFLMGAHMIMKLDFEVATAMEALAPLLPCTVPYCDVSPDVQTFHLYLEDCLGGLYQAKQLEWVRFDAGRFNAEEYNHYDDPLNADLHEIIPGKFIAMRGPIPLPEGQQWHDHRDAHGTFSHRDFSPAHYADILPNFGVRTVLRLNSPHYDSRAFATRGIATADLYFDDCSTPPAQVLTKFLTLADRLPGSIAVHCRAGLGRTGTLIAAYMMRHHGFTAREAIGWLRIVRPGSVIGPQQNYLVDKEPLLRRHPAPPSRPPSADNRTPSFPPCESRPADGEDGGGDSSKAAAAAAVEEVQRLIEYSCRRIDARVRALREAAPSARRTRCADGGAGDEDSPRPAAAGPTADGGEADAAASAAAAAAAEAARAGLAEHVSRVAERRSSARTSSDGRPPAAGPMPR